MATCNEASVYQSRLSSRLSNARKRRFDRWPRGASLPTCLNAGYLGSGSAGTPRCGWLAYLLRVLQELEAELRQKGSQAGWPTTMQQAVTSAVGRIYQEVLASPDLLRSTTEASRSLDGLDSEDEQFVKARTQTVLRTSRSNKELTEDNEELSQLIARELLRRQGLSVNGTELELAENSLKRGLREAGRFGQQINEVGYLAKESEAGKELREAASKPKPVTLKEVAEHKIKWNNLSESAIHSHEYALRAWEKIIKKNYLEDINTQNLNQFLEHLATEGWNGGTLLISR